MTPSLTLYTTGFCAPCRTARTILERATDDLTEVNLSDHPDAATTLGITSTPTLIASEGETELWRVEGVPRLAPLRELLTRTGFAVRT